MSSDLSDVASRESHLAGTAQRISSELASSRSTSTAVSAELKEMRSQVVAMRTAIQSKDKQLEEFKSALKHGGEVCVPVVVRMAIIPSSLGVPPDVASNKQTRSCAGRLLGEVCHLHAVLLPQHAAQQLLDRFPALSTNVSQCLVVHGC